MTRADAQALAPSYLRLPNDGADFKCQCCKESFPHYKVFITFTPDGVNHWGVTCQDCLDEHWFSKAKDCGVIG
jgi:hypothetical protein